MNDQPQYPTPNPAAPQPPVAPPGGNEWPAAGGPAWAPDQQPPAYGAQPGAPYYAQPQQGAYPGYPGSGDAGYPPPGSGGTSGFAVASLIFGILGGIMFSVIFGIVALVQIRKRGQTGRGLAITGLVLSGCWVLVIAGGVAAAIISDAGNDDAAAGASPTATATATATANGTVSVTELKPGQCINGINAIGSIEDLPVVSCARPHEGEVYAVFELPRGPWPGDAKVQGEAEKRCEAALKTYAPKPADTVKVLYLHPLEVSWSRDRGVTCVATDDRGTTRGSVRD